MTMTAVPLSVSSNASGELKVGELLRDPRARAILEKHMPELRSLSTQLELSGHALRLVARTSPALADSAGVEQLLAEVAEIPPPLIDGRVPDYPGERPVTASCGPAWSPDSTDAVDHRTTVQQFERFEVALSGPAHGNPFVDVVLSLELDTPAGRLVVPGFYDGDGTYRVRYLAEAPGDHRFVTRSNAHALNGIRGAFYVESTTEHRGPVRVSDGFHFAYANGERYVPVGTTAYAWTHQGDDLEERTLATLSEAPFNKIRMCIFPKSYAFNENDPERFPFSGSPDDGFDWERFDVAYWAHLEERIADLAALNIQADLILFHPYDRWGFSTMPPHIDDLYVRYAVARLASSSNVWWSLANEYDLVETKTEDDWERLAAVVHDADPTAHLVSIHNCFDFYDYGRPWVTHASVQRQDIYKTAEMTDEWRQRWGKPVVIDECGYEGDIDQGWGNITGEEMIRRFWEGAVRGGYVAHGETYLSDDDELWWSKGGELRGTSPARIAFLREVLESAPRGLAPLHGDWDIPSAGVSGRYLLYYYGYNQPRYRRFVWDPDIAYSVDIIDTWNMTETRLPDPVRGRFRIELPGRPYMALRFEAIDDGHVDHDAS